MSEGNGTGNAKLGAAVIGGYLLGRFKKGRQAMRLASYLNGGQTPPQMLLSGGKGGVEKVMANEQAKQIVEQLRGPLLEAVQGIVLGRINASVTNLSGKLEDKTKELTSGAGKTVEATADTATDTVKGVTDTVTGGGDKREEGEEPQRDDDTEADRQADAGLDKAKASG